MTSTTSCCGQPAVSFFAFLQSGEMTVPTGSSFVYVGRTNNDLCPVSVVLTYLVHRGIDDSPLFRTEDIQPLTQQKLTDLFCSTLTGIEPSKVFGHSFRIEAATMAAANGVSDSTIQSLGREASGAFLQYIRTNS